MLGVPVYDKIQQTAVIEQRDSMKEDAWLTSHLKKTDEKYCLKEEISNIHTFNLD